MELSRQVLEFFVFVSVSRSPNEQYYTKQI